MADASTNLRLYAFSFNMGRNRPSSTHAGRFSMGHSVFPYHTPFRWSTSARGVTVTRGATARCAPRVPLPSVRPAAPLPHCP